MGFFIFIEKLHFFKFWTFVKSLLYRWTRYSISIIRRRPKMILHRRRGVWAILLLNSASVVRLVLGICGRRCYWCGWVRPAAVPERVLLMVDLWATRVRCGGIRMGWAAARATHTREVEKPRWRHCGLNMIKVRKIVWWWGKGYNPFLPVPLAHKSYTQYPNTYQTNQVCILSSSHIALPSKWPTVIG